MSTGSATSGDATSKGRIKIVHIYPREMSIYGDLGNTRCLASRLRWHCLLYTSDAADE